MKKKVRIALGAPWYDGPDRDTAANQLIFSHYLGRLQERLWWISQVGHIGFKERWPKLDQINTTGFSEIPEELFGTQFEFVLCEEMGCSLPGMARERIIDAALSYNCDYVLFYDDDMLFGTDALLRLYMNQVPVCAALAFTGREPITPVIYSFTNEWDEAKQVDSINIQPVCDYKRDALQKVDAVGGGMMLIQMDVFRLIEKPWFNSTGMGEDIFFSYRCGKAGIPVHVDTRVKTLHKPTFPNEWQDELKFQREYEKQKLNGRHTDLEQLAAAR